MAKHHENDAAVLAFITERTANGGASPTYREIAAAVGLKSTCSVHRILHRLIKGGLIAAREPWCTRNLYVVGRDVDNSALVAELHSLRRELRHTKIRLRIANAKLGNARAA